MQYARTLPKRRNARQDGAGIVETLVGILIGMIVVAVIYNMMIVAEGFRRNTLGLSDAQTTGQLSQFLMGRELANAGNGVMAGDGVNDLALCDSWQLRPIPSLIVDGGAPDVSDTLTVFYSNSPRIVHPVTVQAPQAAVATDPITVASPNGFKPGDWFIATDRGTNCTLGQVNVGGITQPGPGFGAYPPAAAGGFVALAFTRKAGATFIYPTGSSRVVNLGQNMTRTTYSVDPAKLQLYTTDANPGLAVAATPVPMAQNVVLLKAQYGVDTDNDQFIDCWTSAVAGGCGLDYSDAAFKLTPAPASLRALIRSVKAVRIAVVVRSDDIAKPETINPADKEGVVLKNQAAWLFNCAANTNAACQGRMQVTSAVLQDYNRYRIYEAVIPLRNSLWNPP